MDKHMNLMLEVCLRQVAANVEGIRAILERLLSQPAAQAPGADATPVTLVNNLVRVMNQMLLLPRLCTLSTLNSVNWSVRWHENVA